MAQASTEKLRLCMVTVLNPALHSRIFYKQALTLAEAGYDVTVIGQDASAETFIRSGIRVVPIRPFGRLGIRRIFIGIYIFFKALPIRADAYILHTPELLLVGMLLRLFTKAKIVYDVHEDYAANIRSGQGYARWVRMPLAALVRAKERLAGRFWLDGAVYAEASYGNLLRMPESRWATIENKFKPLALPAPSHPETGPEPVLLHTGTLAPPWGVFRALELWQALNRLGPVRLCLAGHAPDAGLLAEIEKIVSQSGLSERFRLLGGKDYLPYETLVVEIAACDLGLALYTEQENLSGRIPTKFEEFRFAGKPLLFTARPDWVALNQKQGYGIPISYPFQPEAIAEIYQNLSARKWPGWQPAAPAQAPWDLEAPKLLSFYARMLNQKPH